MKDFIKYKKALVLIVDNDKDLSSSITKLLEMSAINAIAVKTYDEAKHIIDNVTIHLAIINYQLEGPKFGTDVVEYLKRQKSHIPIIMLSDDDDHIIKIGSLESGANIFLLKPVDYNDLIKFIKNALSLVNVFEDLEDAENIILALTRAVELKDNYTEGHSQRVAQYSVDLFDKLDLDDWNDRNALYVGCLLHDIGKLGIRDNILKSSSELSDEERKEIESHPEKGYEVCKDLTRLGRALLVIRNHHEKLDGSGYPDSLKGDDIPLIVRISTIADMYDAITSDRSYRKGNTQSEAFKMMQNEVNEEKIDELLFKTFKKMIIENDY